MASTIVIQGLTSPLYITSGYGLAGAPPAGFNLVSIADTGSQLILTFTEALNLSLDALDFSKYTVTGGEIWGSVTITSLSVAGAVLTLGITQQHDGAQYQLHIPPLGFASVFGDAYLGTLEPFFFGVSAHPGLASARIVDARTVELIYTEAVDHLDAENSQNYSIPNHIVFQARRLSPVVYRLTTSRLDVNTADFYTVTVANVHDLLGNLIT